MSKTINYPFKAKDMKKFHLRRIRIIMRPEPGNALEAEGVLNPAAIRGPDGELYLFPPLVTHIWVAS